MAIAMMHIDKMNRASSNNRSFMGYIYYMDRINGTDEVYFQNFSYSHIRDASNEKLISTCTYTPQCTITDINEQTELWKKLGIIEADKNACIGFNGFACLPIEASPNECKAIADNFAKSLTDKGLTCKLSIHYEESNPHFHFIIAERQLNQNNEWQNVKCKKINADLIENNKFYIKASADPKLASELKNFYIKYFKEFYKINVTIDIEQVSNNKAKVTLITDVPNEKLEGIKVPEYDFSTKMQKIRKREGRADDLIWVRINKEQSIAQSKNFYEFLRHNFELAHNSVMPSTPIDMRSYKRQGISREGGIHSQAQYQANKRAKQNNIVRKWRFNIMKYNNKLHEYNELMDSRDNLVQIETEFNQSLKKYKTQINKYLLEPHTRMSISPLAKCCDCLQLLLPQTAEMQPLNLFLKLAKKLMNIINMLKNEICYTQHYHMLDDIIKEFMNNTDNITAHEIAKNMIIPELAPIANEEDNNINKDRHELIIKLENERLKSLDFNNYAGQPREIYLNTTLLTEINDILAQYNEPALESYSDFSRYLNTIKSKENIKNKVKNSNIQK